MQAAPSLRTVKLLLWSNSFVSAVGHQSFGVFFIIIPYKFLNSNFGCFIPVFRRSFLFRQMLHKLGRMHTVLRTAAIIRDLAGLDNIADCTSLRSTTRGSRSEQLDNFLRQRRGPSAKGPKAIYMS
uniref:Uncharacterized protein n=1 Tax=Schistocephalus solidus TaxID=70667 RepID=A0A0X3PW36_SCHSO